MNRFYKLPMMSMGEYFAKSWELFRKHFKFIIASVGITIGVGVLIGLFFGLFGAFASLTRNPLMVLPMVLLYFVAIAGLLVLATLLGSGLVAQVYYPELTFGQAIKVAAKRFWPALGGVVLVGFINFGVGLLGGLIVMLLVFTIILAPFGVIGLQFLLLVLNAKLAFVLPAIIIDGKGPGEAIGESWNMTKDYLWPYIGRYIVLELIVGAIAFGVMFIGVIFILIPMLISPVLGVLFMVVFGILLVFGVSLLAYYMYPITIYMYGYLKDLNQQNQVNSDTYNATANNSGGNQPIQPQTGTEMPREEAAMMGDKTVPNSHEDMTISPQGESLYENDFQTAELDAELEEDVVHDEPVYEDEK